MFKIEDLNIINEFRSKKFYVNVNVISPFYHIFNADDYIYDKNMNLKFINQWTKLEERGNIGFILYDHLLKWNIYIWFESDQKLRIIINMAIGILSAIIVRQKILNV